MSEGDWLYIATDLKDYAYCPRFVYYTKCLPDFRPRTFIMEAGKEAHEEEHRRAARRSLAAYGLGQGERIFDVALRSERLGIAGRVDEVVVQGSDPPLCFPVDYKLSNRVSPHHRLQLAGYALLLEDVWNATVRQGYIYLIARRRAEPVEIDEALRKKLFVALADIRRIAEREEMPPSAPASRCRVCEFRRTCNDVV